MVKGGKISHSKNSFRMSHNTTVYHPTNRVLFVTYELLLLVMNLVEW